MSGPDLQPFGAKFVQMFQAVVQHMCCILSPDMNLAEVYATANSKTQAFFRSLFLSKQPPGCAPGFIAF
jgi:hypothetical protein